jgi:hypothetical protein
VRLSRCRGLARRPLTGTWYRAIRPQYFQTALAFAHTATIPGRFNPGSSLHPGFSVLYLAEDPIVALYEVNAMLGSPLPGQPNVPNPASPWAVLNVAVRLNRVADLCRISQRRLVETTVQELTGDWRGYSLRNPNAVLNPPYWTNVPTQRLGTALRAVPKLQGFTTFSARLPTKRILVVFPDRLRGGARLRFTDPATGKAHIVP